MPHNKIHKMSCVSQYNLWTGNIFLMKQTSKNSDFIVFWNGEKHDLTVVYVSNTYLNSEPKLTFYSNAIITEITTLFSVQV